MISDENGQNWSIFGFSTTPLHLGVELRLGKPETPPEKFLLCLGEPLRLGVALLHLSQATIPVVFFLRLILEFVTLLFGLSMEDN